MNRLPRRVLALMGTAALTAGMVGVTPATSGAAPKALAAAGTPFAQARFASYATGSEVHLGAVSLGPTTLASVEQAFSGVSANSGGLPTALNSKTIPPALIQPALPTKNASARGSGLEVGLGTTPAVANQLQLGIAESSAPPISPPVTKTVVPLSIPGVLTAGVLKGIAAAVYSPTFCPLGQPIALGEGDAAGVGLLGNPPLLQTVGNTGVTQVAQSISRTDLVANADGTFGLQSTVHEIVAPIILNLASVPGVLTVQLQVSVQGAGPDSPITLSAFTDGNGHQVAGVANNADQVVISLVVNGVATPIVNLGLNALLGAGGLNLSPSTPGLIGTLLTTLAGLGLNVSVKVATPPTITTSNNFAAASFDLVSLNVNLTGVLALGQGAIGVANLNVGHMETGVALPSGSIACNVPVGKTANPAVVQAGSNFVWTISIPSKATDLGASTCDLTHIKVTDVISVKSGAPTFTVGAISNGGVYNAATKTITWGNLGTYHPGDPPIMVTVNVSVPANSAAGVLQDTATVAAGLGNCTGGATGTATAIGNVSNVVIGGSITLVAPEVQASGAGLATTGTGPLLPWLAVGLLVLAEATRRLLRQAKKPQALS